MMKKKWLIVLGIILLIVVIINGSQYLFSKEEFRTVDNYRFMERG